MVEELLDVHALVACCTALTPPSEMPTCPGVVCQRLTEAPVSKPKKRRGEPSLEMRNRQLAGAEARADPSPAPAAAVVDCRLSPATACCCAAVATTASACQGAPDAAAA